MLTSNLRFIPSVSRMYSKKAKKKSKSAKVYQSQCAHFPVNNFIIFIENLGWRKERRERLKCVPDLSVCNTANSLSENVRHQSRILFYVCLLAFWGVRIRKKKHFLHQTRWKGFGNRHVKWNKQETIDTLNRIFRSSPQNHLTWRVFTNNI